MDPFGEPYAWEYEAGFTIFGYKLSSMFKADFTVPESENQFIYEMGITKKKLLFSPLI